MKFHSNILLKKNDEKILKKLNFNNIKLDCEDEPTGRFYQSKNNKSHSFYSNRIEKINEDEIPFKILTIEAENREIVEDFHSVLISSLLMIFPDVNKAYTFNQIKEYTNDFHNDEYLNFINFNPNYDFNISLALKITEKCFPNDDLVYSLEKFKISVHLFSFNPFSADPKYGNLFNNKFVQREQHTNQAFAIITAFSVIEELGLEIRSSSKNKRFLDNEKGIWNPSVLENITNRLSISNIPENETFDWIFRGNITEIENDLKPYFGIDSIWCHYGDEVRDKTLTIPEAIHNASYLRNFMASHKFNKLTKFINPYDVFNIQQLSRMLFLKKIDFWKLIVKQ